MRAEYPPVQMEKAIKKMTAQEVNVNFLGIFSALKCNGESLWDEDMLQVGVRRAPKGMLEFVVALTDRAEELGYDVIKKYEPLLLGKETHAAVERAKAITEGAECEGGK